MLQALCCYDFACCFIQYGASASMPSACCMPETVVTHPARTCSGSALVPEFWRLRLMLRLLLMYTLGILTYLHTICNLSTTKVTVARISKHNRSLQTLVDSGARRRSGRLLLVFDCQEGDAGSLSRISTRQSKTMGRFLPFYVAGLYPSSM